MRYALSILLSLAIAAAQDPPEGLVTFKTTTQMVIVNVMVKDRKGKPIDGLQAADFTILEDGTPQKIAAFEYQHLGEDSVPRGTPLAGESDPGMAKGIASSGPGKVRYKDRRLLVMLFDLASMPPAEMWRAQDAALRFLREQMEGPDIVAVMAYTKQLDVLQDFTSDRDRLVQVIENLPVSGDDLAAGGAAGDENDGGEDEFGIFNTDRKLAALGHAVTMLGGLAERKALVYFAAGSGGTGAENESQLRSTINAAQRSNVSFYPVDARGLAAQAPLGNASMASPGGVSVYSGEAARQVAIQLGGEDETLYRMAKETGGKMLVNTNDLALGLRQAQKDLASYYIVGYYSTNPAQDGKHRRIRVQLNTKTAAMLDYRTGYFAPKEFSQFSAADRERQLEEALLLGDPMTDLRLAVEVDYFRSERNRYLVPVALKIPGREIHLAAEGSTRIDFIGQVRDAAGSVAATVRENIAIQLNSAYAAGLAQRTLQYDTTFLLEPGSYTLKFLARENETGKMGTFETLFVVPDLATELDYLPISSVVLSNRREVVSTSPETGRVAFRTRNPLIQGSHKLTPSVTRVFRKDQQMYVFLEAYRPPERSTPPVTVRVAFYRGKTKAFESEALRFVAAPGHVSGEIPVTLTVPLTMLQPGRYTCQVTVLAPAASKFVFWRAPIVLLP